MVGYRARAERVFALGRDLDARAGEQRDDTRAGILGSKLDNTVDFMAARENREAEWRALRKRARKAMLVTMQMQRLEVGMAERASRQEKLAAKRAKRKAKAAEAARVQALAIATKYSELKTMGIDELKDQLRAHKARGKTGFTISLPNRTALILQLQALLHEADPSGANDLTDGDSGVEGRAIRRKAAPQGGRTGGKKRKKAVQTYMGYEWDNDADYNLDAIVGHVTTDGKTVYANQVRLPALPCHVRSLTPSLLSQGKMRAGVKLYRCVWEDFPPDVLWYEIEANIDGTIAYAEYLERLANDESDEAAAAQEEAELEEMEEEELMPPP